ncbi:DUF4124 domain-containing protein [Aquitalea pelogenes]|uniref:DUF4124 domain-containing protein n=1 Tax=Aquitalea pelogenes TaxID=1293573 RepID=UPI0035AFBF9C
MKSYFVLSIILMMPMGVSAGAYRCTGANGAITYTDTPCSNGNAVTIHDSHMGEPALPKNVPQQVNPQNDVNAVRKAGCQKLIAQYEAARRNAANSNDWGQQLEAIRTTKQLAPGYNACLLNGY